MNYLQLSQYWAMEPVAYRNMRSLISSILPNIAQGHADNAERAGFPVRVHGKVAIVSLKGPMIKEDGVLSRYYGFASSRSVKRAIESSVADDAIESIVLVVGSPGGSVEGLAELGDAVAKAKNVKPVIVQVDGMAMSAAYYVASQGSKIYAGRGDLIGSIGTRIMLYDTSEYYNGIGVKAIPIDTGEHKSAGADGTVITENQQKEFQRIVDGYFEDFLNTVSSGRGMSVETVKQYADGRVFFAEQAVDFGLIDGIQSLDETLISQIQPVQRTTRMASNRLKLQELSAPCRVIK